MDFIPPFLARYATPRMYALGGQVAVSGGNFLSMIVIARATGQAGFGAFSLAWLWVLGGNGLMLALWSQPLQWMAPRMDAAHAEQHKQAMLIPLIVSILPLALLATVMGHQPQVWVAAVPFLLLEQTRRLLLIRDRAGLAFFADALGNGLKVLILSILWALDLLTVDRVFWVIGATCALSVLVSLPGLPFVSALERRRAGLPRLSGFAVTREHLHEGRWLLASALLQWVAGNTALLAMEHFLGTGALGGVRMVQTLMGLLHVLFIAYENTEPREAARIFHEDGMAGINRYLRRGTVRWLLTFVPVLALLTLAAPWLLTLVYGTAAATPVLRAFALMYVLVVAGYPLRFALLGARMSGALFAGYVLTAISGLVWWVVPVASPLLVVLALAVNQAIMILSGLVALYGGNLATKTRRH